MVSTLTLLDTSPGPGLRCVKQAWGRLACLRMPHAPARCPAVLAQETYLHSNWTCSYFKEKLTCAVHFAHTCRKKVWRLSHPSRAPDWTGTASLCEPSGHLHIAFWHWERSDTWLHGNATCLRQWSGTADACTTLAERPEDRQRCSSLQHRVTVPQETCQDFSNSLGQEATCPILVNKLSQRNIESYHIHID